MVKSARAALLSLLALLVVLPAGAGAEDFEELVHADLVVDGGAMRAGETYPVAVRLRMEEGWHVYWINPGDSGLPTEVEWKLPRGHEVGPLQWPVPEIYWAGPIINYGYEGEILLLSEVQAPADLQPGDEVIVAASTSWLVCNPETCIPGKAADLQRKVIAGEADEDAALLAEAKTRLPAEAPWPVQVRDQDGTIVLAIDEPALAEARIEKAYFFASEAMVVEHGADQELVRTETGIELHLQLNELAEGVPGELEGVLVIEEDLGGQKARQGFSIHATKAGARQAAVGATEEAATPGASLGLFQVLGLALLGGLILNLMPCVFPVLSLKVLGVAQQAGEDQARVRLHGVAYTAGILLSFAALAGALLLLRAGGEEIGWGFQLQSPIFVAILAYVMMAMALSLSGVIQFGGSLMGLGSSLAARPGLAGSFFTGVLATVVATPCTAPFMGAALGFAITQPAPIAMAIFLALGFGLALPFLVLSFVPALHRRMPKPGAWMLTLQQALAFPLYGTVAWLVWVLHLQIGSDGLAAVLAGLVLLSLALWAWGSSRLAGGLWRKAGAVVGVVAMVGAAMLIPAGPQGAGAPVAAASADGNQAGPAWEAWTEARMEEALAEGKPVFVNFTAAWCVTCLVNERTAMATAGVQSLFEENEVVYLKGDWTNRDPAITRTLEKYGRSGVPLYLYYPAGADEPVVLPQILTEAIVRDHVGS